MRISMQLLVFSAFLALITGILASSGHAEFDPPKNIYDKPNVYVPPTPIQWGEPGDETWGPTQASGFTLETSSRCPQGISQTGVGEPQVRVNRSYWLLLYFRHLLNSLLP